MARYIGPQLRRTYDAVVRTLMPWRMIDALSSLDEAEKRNEDVVSERPSDGRRDGPGSDPPTSNV